jgi:hypothetical protein
MLAAYTLSRANSPTTIQRWRIDEEGNTALEPFLPDFDVGAVALSPSNVWALGEKHGSNVFLFNGLIKTNEAALKSNDARGVSVVSFADDGRYLAAGFLDGHAAVW